MHGCVQAGAAHWKSTETFRLTVKECPSRDSFCLSDCLSSCPLLLSIVLMAVKFDSESRSVPPTGQPQRSPTPATRMMTQTSAGFPFRASTKELRHKQSHRKTFSNKICNSFHSLAEISQKLLQGGWDALTAQTKDSAACVFLCKPEDGLGLKWRTRRVGRSSVCCRLRGSRLSIL